MKLSDPGSRNVIRLVLLVVFGVANCFVPGGANGATDAFMSLKPPVTTLRYPGLSVGVAITEDSGNTLVNALQVVLQYPANLVQVSSVSTSGSRFDEIIPGGTYSGGSGILVLQRQTGDTGVTGLQLVANITFVARAVGTAQITFGADTWLAASGNGEHLSLGFGESTISVGATPTPAPTATPVVAASSPPVASATTNTPIPTVLTTPTVPETAQTDLPDTGTAALGAAVGLSAMTYVAWLWMRTRRRLRVSRRGTKR